MIATSRRSAKFDCVSLGEVLLRLDPGEGRISMANGFRVWEGGGEYNVARSLASCFRLKTSIVTALVRNPIGTLLERLISQGMVDASNIVWREFDGLGVGARNGLNFTERGFGLRSAVGVADRFNTAASQLKPGDVDWGRVFGEDGCRWFHVGGILPALGEGPAALCLEGCRAAREFGVPVSCDLNYRSSIWDRPGFDRRRAIESLRRIVGESDALFGGQFDFLRCLDVDTAGRRRLDSWRLAAPYAQICQKLLENFPQLRCIATTQRRVVNASSNDWAAVGWFDGKVVRSGTYQEVGVLDRVGSGDAFASGLIFGLLAGVDCERALEYGAAHGALAMTTPGDTSMATLEEVESLMSGRGEFAIKR